VIVAVRETTTTVKIMVLVLWHAIRYPHDESVVDYDAGTVTRSDDDD